MNPGDASNGPEAAPRLDAAGVSVRYGNGSAALFDVSLQVGRGERVALLGPNGAGKTTLLRAVSGLLRVHGGRVETGRLSLDGVALQALDAARRVRAGIAQVMEGRRIFADLTVRENLLAGAHTRSRRAPAGSRVEDTLDEVLAYFPVLRERLHSAAGYLSGGEQQMLAIGRALMARPTLLLLDEPSLGVAPKIVEQISGILARINERGVAMLIVEQNASVALALCHRAYILENGRVAAHGTSAQLAQDERVRDIYLGASAEGRRSFRRPAATGAA
jgi:branched-chain amino acid transport system ATP-binding protein